MTAVREFESKFTGMIFLLRRVILESPDGRVRMRDGPDMGYARHRPRHA